MPVARQWLLQYFTAQEIAYNTERVGILEWRN